jgi:hypothetical protein
MTDSPFSKDFRSARERFVKAASDAKAAVESHAYPATGPGGEALSTEVAWVGPADARNVLVMVSGTHGVEGFCGSAAQVDWLNRGEAQRLPRHTAALLIHAINPFGFAWLRRVTHENIDLNRNWIDFSRPVARRVEYDEIAPALCPSAWNEGSRAQTLAVLQRYIAQHGMRNFVVAVSGGQHHHPDGLFFGGTAPCVARLTLESILTARLQSAQRIGIIDYHTGLGPSGFGELMVGATVDGAAYQRTRSWYGAAVTPVGSQDSASAAIGGDWISAAPALLPRATVTAIAIEFGTVNPLQVLDALRADNWLHVHGEPASSCAGPIKKAILDAFYIDADLWKGMILGQSLAVTRQAIAGLQM